MKRILFLGIICLLIGCKSTDLCGQKNWSITRDQKLKKEYINYFSTKSDNHTEIGQRSAPLIANHHQVLKKQQDEFRYFEGVSLFGGLVAQGNSKSIFDKGGDKLYTEANFDLLAGLFRSMSIKNEYENNVIKSASSEDSFLVGLLYSEKLMIDSKKNVTESMDFMLKAFGSSQRADGSKYVTFLWIPIKTSN